MGNSKKMCLQPAPEGAEWLWRSDTKPQIWGVTQVFRFGQLLNGHVKQGAHLTKSGWSKPHSTPN